ncbi:MAG: hypothetical protein NTW26_04990 [bacterium]|nr:hypothetical protein [bacterium]
MRGRVLLLFTALALTLACETTGPQTAPDVPHGLAAVSGLDSRVDLAWRAPTSGEPEHYRVYRSEAGGDFEQLVERDGADTEYTDASAVNGTYYEYQITALTGGEESDPSDAAWATPYYDFEWAWTSTENYWLPTEGEGVFYCTERPFDVAYLCRISTDGEHELQSDQTCWGFSAVGTDNIYTMGIPLQSAMLRVWTMDLEWVESIGFLETEYKELGFYSGELFTINVDTGVVDVLDTQGNHLRSIGEPGYEGSGMTDPFGLDVSPGGTLYVVDMMEESLLAFDAVSGALVWRISAPDLPADFRFPSDAAVAPDGFVYLVSGFDQEFLVIDSAGRQIKRVPFDWEVDEVYHLAVADDFTVCLSWGEREGNGMVAYRPVGLSGNETPPVVALQGGGVR